MTDFDLKRFENEVGELPEALLEETLGEVSSWLGRLVLLYGVPFHYLIPEEPMLPPESLRFFFVDPIWIQCLVQGACSIGSNGYGDAVMDRAMNQWVQPNQPWGKDRASAANQEAASVRDRLRLQYEGVALPSEECCLNWPLTGFLLRSAVVEGWRGLEVLAYGSLSGREIESGPPEDLNDKRKAGIEEDVVPLKPLRIEQLSGDVMLCIFNGVIAQLVIRQPREGLHFGLTPEKGAYTKTLRELGHKDPNRAGQVLPGLTIDLAGSKLLRDQEYPGVIRVAAAADAMKDLLRGAGELKNDSFTSAEFAVEMIEAAGEFTCKPNIRNVRTRDRASQ